MKFPAMLYKTPGPHHGPAGSTYDFKQARDEEAAQALMAAGWSPTLPGAVLMGQLQAAAPAADVPDEDAPPTRAELEARARELGIDFTAGTRDATLAKRIAEKLTP